MQGSSHMDAALLSDLWRSESLSLADKWQIAKDLARFIADLDHGSEMGYLEIQPLTKDDLKPLRKVIKLEFKDAIARYVDYDFEGKQYYFRPIHGDLRFENLWIQNGKLQSVVPAQKPLQAAKAADLAALLVGDVQFAHMVARAYFEYAEVHLDLEFALYLAIHRCLVGLLACVVADPQISDMTALRKHECAAPYLRGLEHLFVMSDDVFRDIVAISNDDIVAAIVESYRRMGFQKSAERAESFINTWSWSASFEGDLIMNDLEEIYSVLNDWRSCFIDHEFTFYESFDEVCQASDQFHALLMRILLRGYMYSPWLPDDEGVKVRCMLVR